VAHGIGLPGLLVFLGLGLALGEQVPVSGSMMPGWRRRWGSARWC
jgi:hypothetical protein